MVRSERGLVPRPPRRQRLLQCWLLLFRGERRRLLVPLRQEEDVIFVQGGLVAHAVSTQLCFRRALGRFRCRGGEDGGSCMTPGIQESTQSRKFEGGDRPFKYGAACVNAVRPGEDYVLSTVRRHRQHAR